MVFDSFVPEVRPEFESVEESVGEKTADVGKDSKHYRRPPSSTETGQAFGEIIVIGEEGAFDGPDASEKEVGIRPLILGVGVGYILVTGGLGEVKDLYILNGVCFGKHGGIDDVSGQEADHGQDD